MKVELKHYGMPRRSGRYPWGSGDTPYQRAISWRGTVKEMKSKGMTEKQIADAEGITINQFRARNTLVKDEIRSADRAEAIRLRERGMSNMEIGRRMGKNESSIRNLLDEVIAERAAITVTTVNMLRDEVDSKRYIDIGKGVENSIGVSRTRLNTAIAGLEEEGYKVHNINIPQAGIKGQFTEMKILGAPDTEYREIVRPENSHMIKSISVISDNFGRSYKSDLGLKPVENVSSDRIKIRYKEDGGADKDGVIELRRGTPDLDMGGSSYAQVRIGVDGTHFLKGMAIYNDNMPEGVDIIFNTNKHSNVPMIGSKDNTVLKPMKKTVEGIIDPDNPFGATIKEGGQRGALNIVNEEGDWQKWSKTISSQVLSKQTVPLAKNQLDLAFNIKREEYDEISALTNPVVKKQLLLAFADDCDASAVHLKAAGLPRQSSKVILPVPELKPNEVYAPTFNDGEPLVLIRHPHGGRFEIPLVTVNNKSKAAKAIMENAPDAIGIHPDVAKKLSGADFDGDAVIVIPNSKGLIKTSNSLKSLENFDPIESYRIPAGSKVKPMTKQGKQSEMGKVSNLITDMTIKGATDDEIARAVKHSMVVIDAEKHNLDYRQSYKDQGIDSLVAKYQDGGASTLISRSKSKLYIPERKPRAAKEGGAIDPITGKKMYTDTGSIYTNRKGKIVTKTSKVTKMEYTDDPYTLSSGRQIEIVYAGYANNLKKLANKSRKEALATGSIIYSPSAKEAYATEVASLNSKLNIAYKHKPLERQAQVQTNAVVERKKQDNPDMDDDDIKKARNQALSEARIRTGAAEKARIPITDKEWEAIQAGALHTSKVSEILQNTDLDRVKELATPRTKTSMSSAKISRAKLMIESGATLKEVADSLGVSVTTLTNALE